MLANFPLNISFGATDDFKVIEALGDGDCFYHCVEELIPADELMALYQQHNIRYKKRATKIGHVTALRELIYQEVLQNMNDEYDEVIVWDRDTPKNSRITKSRLTLIMDSTYYSELDGTIQEELKYLNNMRYSDLADTEVSSTILKLSRLEAIKDGEYAGDFEIRALEKLLKRPFIIYQKELPDGATSANRMKRSWNKMQYNTFLQPIQPLVLLFIYDKSKPHYNILARKNV